MNITNKQILLREFKTSDAPNLVAIFQHIAVARYMGIPYPYTLEAAKESIEKYKWEQKKGKAFFFAVINKEDNKLIWYVWLNHICTTNLRWEIEYGIDQSYWWKWYWTEIVRKIVDFGFHMLHLNRIFWQVRAPNIASCKVLEKVWFLMEGRLRENVYDRYDKVRLDHIVYWLLKKEYY